MRKRGQPKKAPKRSKRISGLRKRESFGSDPSSCLTKRAYPTYGEAVLAAESVNARQDVPVSIYDCVHCEQFHLTSRPWQ